MLAGVLVVAMVAGVASGGAEPPAEDLLPDRSWTPEPGDTGVVYPDRDRSTTFASKDVFAYLAMVKAVNARDDVGISELRSQGQVMMVPAHTRFLVIARHTGAIVTGGINAVEVRFLEGEHKDQVAWIPEFDVTRMIPRRQPTEFELELRKTGSERSEAEQRKAKERADAYEAISRQVREEAEADAARKRSLRAATTLRSAANLEKAGKIPGAIGLYRGIVKDYPGTPQAEAASARIAALGGR